MSLPDICWAGAKKRIQRKCSKCKSKKVRRISLDHEGYGLLKITLVSATCNNCDYHWTEVWGQDDFEHHRLETYGFWGTKLWEEGENKYKIVVQKEKGKQT